MNDHPPETWEHVSYLEFDRYLRQYPRALLIDPPLNQPARFRTWRDVTIGKWPSDVVAKQFDTHSRSFWVRREIGGTCEVAGRENVESDKLGEASA